MLNGKDQDFGEKTRMEARKKKRLNRILNTSIVVVGGLILFFASQLFFAGEEQAVEEEDSVLEEETEEQQTTPDANPDTEETEENQDENSKEGESSITEENAQEDGPRIPDAPREDGTWEPIGTSQSGSFRHDFNKGSQNWKEMEMALQYATGLSSEEMIIWQLENGGERTAIGTVSNKENQAMPFQVTMQFVENEGWQPVEVKVLDSNPYG